MQHWWLLPRVRLRTLLGGYLWSVGYIQRSWTFCGNTVRGYWVQPCTCLSGAMRGSDDLMAGSTGVSQSGRIGLGLWVMGDRDSYGVVDFWDQHYHNYWKIHFSPERIIFFPASHHSNNLLCKTNPT